jgi:hypothetical protein
MIAQPIINRSYLFEVPLGTVAVQSKVNFLYNSNLEGKEIYGLQTIPSSFLAFAPSGAAAVSVLGLSGLVITLSVGSDEQLYQFPASDFFPGNVSGLIRMLNNKVVNISKSYATILSITNLVNNQSLLLNFIFNPMSKNNS